MRNVILIVSAIFIVQTGFALKSEVPISQLYLVADDGTFLGTFENEYASNSIFNRYGTYGSPYNSNSIFNKYGTYGSDYSQYSPFNAYTSYAPWIVDKQGNRYGRLSINKYGQDVTNDSYKLAVELKAMRDAM